MNKFCPNCGTKVPEGAAFCPNCGAKLAPDDSKTAGETVTPKSATAPKEERDAAAAKNTAATKTATNEEVNQPVQTAESGKFTKQLGKLKQLKQTRWIVTAIVVLLVIFIGYRQVYVPHMVQSALSSNNFTTARGYHNVVNPSKHMIVLVANDSLEQKYVKAMAQNEFDTRRINAEDQLSGLAHDLSGRLIGKWKVAICIKDGQKAGVMWEYDGNKEVKRFQTSSAGQQLRQEYQERQEQAAEQAKEEESGEKLGAGLLGGGIGFLLGSL